MLLLGHDLVVNNGNGRCASLGNYLRKTSHFYVVLVCRSLGSHTADH